MPRRSSIMTQTRLNGKKKKKRFLGLYVDPREQSILKLTQKCSVEELSEFEKLQI